MIQDLAQLVVSSTETAYRYDLTDLPFILLELWWFATALISLCPHILIQGD
ncbi:MAG TPA: hypothetical protein V6D50_27070 [Chroococcales cyanobacterium]